MSNNMFTWETDADGILTLTMDDPNAPVNTMNQTFQDDLIETVAKVKEAVEAGEVKGIVLASAKKTFFAGGDIKSMIKATPEDAPALTKQIDTMKDNLRTLETLGVPVAAAINGTALGGGLEIALAAHHRIASDAKPESRPTGGHPRPAAWRWRRDPCCPHAGSAGCADEGADHWPSVQCS